LSLLAGALSRLAFAAVDFFLPVLPLDVGEIYSFVMLLLLLPVAA
jgi:hypothetical protein